MNYSCAVVFGLRIADGDRDTLVKARVPLVVGI